MELRVVRLEMSRPGGAMLKLDEVLSRLIACWRDSEAAPEPAAASMASPPPGVDLLKAAAVKLADDLAEEYGHPGESEPGPAVPTPAPQTRDRPGGASRKRKPPARNLAAELAKSLEQHEPREAAPSAGDCPHVFPDVKFVANKRVCRRCD